MICVNELSIQKCNNRKILEPLTILLSPFAPHISEELWQLLGNNSSIVDEDYPMFDKTHLIESSKSYPISFNAKMRFTIDLDLNLNTKEIESFVLNDYRTINQLNGITPKKVIVIIGKIVNIVY
jgi:leucyl-tRNA synthetase